MPEMTDTELRAMLAAQHAAAMASSNSSKLSTDREKAMAYYNGELDDMPSLPGRSSAVSMDTSDTIEGIMPQLMEIFAGSDDVVKFEPVGPEDVQGAEQETDYINHVFMNQNPGFLVLYSFIKDALLSKVGVVKVWWEETEKEKRETYLNKSEDEFAVLISNPELEVLEHTPNDDGTHDLTVSTKKTTAVAKVMGVPPEEFGIEAAARSIRDCNYCYHKITTLTENDLIEQGYDEEQVKALPTYVPWATSEEVSRDTVDEGGQLNPNVNKSTRRVEITEHYVRMDYKGDGKSCLYRVTTGGQQGEVLKLNKKLDVVEFDAVPFAAMTPVIVTHRFYGKSLADFVMDIQRIKTALIRGGLDNYYLANNRRVEVSEAHSNENTLDDLLVSRPGGIVRVKGPGGIREIEHSDIGPSLFPMMEYMDATREWRTGVTKQGQGLDANALQNETATAVNQAFTASQARVRLIARIFAETGIKDLFWLLHSVVKKHGQQAQVVRLRNNWVTVDPRNWKSRDDLTVNVGLGTGSKEAQLAMLRMLIGAQQQAVAVGMVSKRNLWNSAAELVKLIGRKDPETFFTNPSQPMMPQGMDPNMQQDPNMMGQQQQDPADAPIEAPPDPKMMELQLRQQEAQSSTQIDFMKTQMKERADFMQSQHKAQIEMIQARADMATDRSKVEAEKELAREKFEFDKRLKILEHNAKMAAADNDLELKKVDHANKQEERKAKAEDSRKPKASIEVKHGADELTGPIASVIDKFGDTLTKAQETQFQALVAAIQEGRRPRRIKGPSGKVYQIEDAT
jgi:hypothetical protein